MSVISGGIFSKPRGKTGGIVFGAARTRNGKLATARELVKPSNPNTADQQTQRSKFKSVLDLVRRFGASIYQTAWNRSIGQLPGFQSMMSILLGQISATMEISLVNEINLGVLHFPATMVAENPTSSAFEVNYSTEDGSNGGANDNLIILAFASDDTTRQLSSGVSVFNESYRADGNASVEGLSANTNYQIYAYFVGSGSSEGIYSIAKPLSVSTTV